MATGHDESGKPEKLTRVPDEPESQSRRRLLTGGLAAGTAIATGAVPWKGWAAGTVDGAPALPSWTRYLGSGVDTRPYGSPSEHESGVVRRSVDWLTATTESSVNFTPLHELDGMITPNGLCFERHHGGMAEIDPADHRLMIHGLVKEPLVLTLAELRRLPQESRFCFLECAANTGMEWHGAQLDGCQYTHGMVHCTQYTGVSLKVLLEQVGIEPEGKWILAEGADAAAMTRSIPMDKALDDCLVAYSMNGERLRPEQGYPLRLVVPGFEGNMWIKWLRRIEVGSKPWHHREETSKYTDLMPDGSARRFTWVMDAKSVITSPSPQLPPVEPGFNVIKGIAWSGHGRVERVDVSLDGGVNWKTATLHQPVLPKCVTRFTLNWDWDGSPALLQSRCMDETGQIQPTPAQLQEVRGTESIYHNNGIQTWQVKEDGTVENVRLG